MDSTPNPEPENTQQDNVCIKCGSPTILPGYPNKLCRPCRDGLIRFPIPLWIKLFGAGIAVLMLISIIWLPGNLSAAIALSRAEKAEIKLNYVTEQQELEKAKKLVPGSVDILAHLMIATYYNSDIKTLLNVSNGIGDKNIEDTALYNKLTAVMNETKEYFPSDTFTSKMVKYKKAIIIPDSAYQHYLKKFPMDVFALYSLSSSYTDEEKYSSGDSLLTVLLNIDHGYIPALNLKTMVKRELNQPDSSIYYCNLLLADNHQSIYAMSSKARTLLKTGENKAALQLAEYAYKLDKDMPYNLATLAVAYHLNKNYKQRDEIMRVTEKDSTKTMYMQYAKDVISNKVKFQN